MVRIDDPVRKRARALRKCTSALAAAILLAMALAPVANAKPDEVVTTTSGVTYVSGGAGTEAVDRLRSMESEFNLKLVFALRSGAYVADVRVTIADAGNQVVLDTLAEGPWLLARLPAGTYQVNANYSSTTERRTVAVGAAKLSTIEFRWPSE